VTPLSLLLPPSNMKISLLELGVLKKFISGLGFLITFEIKGNLNSANYLDLLLTKVGTAL
jgi:hypothetical protein